ncbi:general odorant-binding protein 19d [Leptopilina boulardi]|uniref:general odorant-binding protein 19d n=1 Tax=Leptopilina boulardi TaxID=63433 RepID=UPI0021F6941E|nr:general odorant-binding protein 19d [Leptopilina boulardi]
MKSTFFIIVVLFALMSFIKCEDEIKQLREKMIKYANECYKEMNITKEEGKKMRADRDFAKERLRCYSVCFMKKSNELDENNKFHIETISKIEHTLYPEKADEIMKAISICIDKVKNIEDKCDLANAYDDCVQGNVGKN